VSAVATLPEECRSRSEAYGLAVLTGRALAQKNSKRATGSGPVASQFCVFETDANLWVRKRDQGLEFVTACLAFPEVSYALPIHIFRPFRQEDRLAALGAVIYQSCLDIFSGALSSELHDASSAKLPPFPGRGS
jgi:hypothetical protein